MGFELVETDVGEFDPELLAIFDRKEMPRLKADLKILLYLVVDEDSLAFAEELFVGTASLQEKRAPLMRKRKLIGVGKFSH